VGEQRCWVAMGRHAVSACGKWTQAETGFRAIFLLKNNKAI
jgi:hypothetical protein